MDYINDLIVLQDVNYRGLRVVTFKIDPDMLNLLDRYAVKHHMNRSEAIREAIVELLLKDEKGETVPKAKVVTGDRL